MSKIQEFIDAWNAKIDTAIVESQSKIDTYLSTRQTAIALTDPFVLKMPDLKVLNIRENTTIPGFDVTTLGQLFEWSYPINGSKNFSTDSTLYIDNYNIVQDYKFDYNITDSNLYTTGYTYGTMSYLADQYINGITSKLSLNLILDINLKGFIYLDSYKRLKDMGGKVWFDNYMHSLYSSIFGLKISVSKLKYSDYEDISSYIDATLVKQYLKGFYSIGSDFDLGSGDQSKYYQAILEAGDHFFTGTQSSTQSSTQSISDYKLSVIDPKSDNDKKIEGLINFSTTGPNISASSTLNGLPNPYTNTLTNLPVENNTGSISWNSNTLFTDKKQLSDNVVLNLQNMIISKYGLNISLKYEDVGVNNPTDTASQSSTNPSILPVTASIPTSGEYTFDVQIIDTFYNPTIGFLTITGKQDTTFIYNDYGDDELSQEYTEEEFVGEEESLIKLDAINIEELNDIKGFDPENPDPAISTDDKSPYPIPKNKQANISSIVAAMNRKKITNKFTQAAILAIVSKESAFVPRNEGSYAKTSATRIKSIFSKFKKYSDSEVDRIKKIPKEFFDIIYGGKYGNASDEGFKYRGRGFNQLTFKSGYQSMQNKTGHKIVADPDLLNTINVASDCIVAYFLERMSGMPGKLKNQYNTSGDINDFKTLDDAVGAIYHANAGWGNSYSLLVSDSTGGRRKAFSAAPSLYRNLA
jgi:putative chitinase